MLLIDEHYCKKLLKKTDGAAVDETRAEVSSSNRAFAMVIRLVSVRDRSTQEVRQQLYKKGFTEADIEMALERAQNCGLLDDMRFSETFIVSRKHAGKGRRGIELELEQHGIGLSSLLGWPYEYFSGEDKEVEDAIAFLERKPPTAKNKREAAYRKLVSRGFSSQIASCAARTWFEAL